MAIASYSLEGSGLALVIWGVGAPQNEGKNATWQTWPIANLKSHEFCQRKVRSQLYTYFVACHMSLRVALCMHPNSGPECATAQQALIR